MPTTNLQKLENYVEQDFNKMYRIIVNELLMNKENPDNIYELFMEKNYDINYMLENDNEHLCWRGEFCELFEKLDYEEICEIRLLVDKWEIETETDYLHHGGEGLPYDEDPEEFNTRLLDCYISMKGKELEKKYLN